MIHYLINASPFRKVINVVTIVKSPADWITQAVGNVIQHMFERSILRWASNAGLADIL